MFLTPCPDPIARPPDCGPLAALVEHVGVDQCRLDILMSEEFLDRPDVVAILKQMRGEGMAERLGRRMLHQARLCLVIGRAESARLPGA